MHIKHMHEMIERLTDCTKSAIENDQTCVGKYPISDVVDMIKDLNEASYYASIVKAMKESEEEDEAEEKYIKRMLKEERADEYKRMREQYGDEEGERRFYDNYRYANGRFAPKGRGSYMPRSSGRRGYVEPPYYHMMPEDAEWYRDMDRMDGKMYYAPMSGNSGNMGNSANSGRGNMGGDNVRGYEDGYRDGKRDGKSMGSRSDRMRRNYTENKHMNDNSPEGKKKNMENLDSYMKELAGEMTELVEDMDASEKNMVRSKLQTLATKIQ